MIPKNVFIHAQGVCESPHVGAGTRIWAFAHVLSQARIGEDCNICDHVFIENDVIIGNRVTIKSGVQLWDGIRIEDDVFIGPNATFTNDRFPRSKQYPKHFEQTILHFGASIGANATLLPGVQIGQRAMVGAGSVVIRNVPPKAIVVGNPARIAGYVETQATPSAKDVYAVSEAKDVTPDRAIALSVRNCFLWKLPTFRDLRGNLLALEYVADLPFCPVRCFFVYEVNSEEIRGEHAHRLCDQVLLAIHGSLSVVVDDGLISEEIRLDTPKVGLWVKRGVWATQYKFSADAVLAVFASRSYESEDYIRDYETFLASLDRKENFAE